MSSLVFIWIGFLLAISFMESWLKFRAPGVTMEVGLSVGNLVFNALNKVELTLIFLLILFSLFSASKPIYKEVSFLIPMLIVLIQTVVLLPQMDQRVLLLLNKEMLPPSNLHFYYVGGEVLKLTSLSVLGIRLIK
ncbi:MAG: hypothetical protein PHQ74_13885 [Crocinitomicaceae bacterium]|nr:hypothetical protein [Crocinitomicaceae bacterium]